MSLSESLRQQAREGRMLAAEVPAGPGRRAFLIVRPVGGARTLEESLRLAKAQGALPLVDGFVVGHHEYDAQRLDGHDYDIGHRCLRESKVESIEAAESELVAWGFDPGALLAYHLTDAP